MVDHRTTECCSVVITGAQGWYYPPINREDVYTDKCSAHSKLRRPFILSTLHFRTLSSRSCTLNFSRCLDMPVHSSLSLEPSDLIMFSTHTIKRSRDPLTPQGPGGRREEEREERTETAVSTSTFDQHYRLGRKNPRPGCLHDLLFPTVPRADAIRS